MSDAKGLNKIAASSKKKLAIAIALEVVGAIVLALLIACVYPQQSASVFKANFASKLELAHELTSEVRENADAVTERYDSLYQSAADTVALYATSKGGFAYSQAELQGLYDSAYVDALFAVDAQGNILAQCGETSDLSAQIAQVAKEVIANPDSFEPTTVEADDGSMRLYAAAAGTSHAIIAAKQPSEITATVDKLANVSTELSDVAVGQSGFIIAVDSDGVVRHHGNTDLIGKTASEIGLTGEQLEDDFSGDIEIQGERYLAQTCTCGTYTLICALPYAEFYSFTAIYVGIAVVVYLIAASVLVAYLFFAGTDRRRKSAKQDGTERYKTFGSLVRNADIGIKAIPIGLGCLVFALVASLYLNTLVELSSMLVDNNQNVQAASDELTAADVTSAAIDTEATAYVESKAKLCTYILPRLDEQQLTRPFMIELREALACDCVWYYDMDGSVIATDNDFWSYVLSDDPTSFSYQFREILLGRTSEVVAESTAPTGDWDVTKYVGMAVQDSNYKTIGMVEVGSDHTLVAKMKESLSLSSVLHTVQPGNNAFAFAISTDGGTFSYYPDSNLMGELASDYGISEDNQEAGYNDFMTINGETYLCASTGISGAYLYIATPASAITKLSVPSALVTAAFCLIWFIVILAFMCLRTKKSAEQLQAEQDLIEQEASAASEVANVAVDGRVKQTTAAASRWNGRGIKWENRTPGQKVSALCGGFFIIVAVVFLIMVLFADSLFSSDSLFKYILSGSWQPGLNLFALTRCIMMVFVAYAVVEIARRIVRWIGVNLSPKGETVCRLIDSVLRFAFWLVMLYFCLGTLGVDTATLLASAGILTLVIGLGANSLITDILAGLSIVFEGEFQVGDIVTIGGFRGTVQEIGVRTTKIKGNDNNIKVFANRDVTGVLNMTKDYSSVSCTFSFPTTMSLERMESMLADELPKVKDELPAIVKGPFYRGVTEMGDEVKLQIVATCYESDRGQLERDLNREIRLIVEEYLLGPDAKANEIERIAAERFSDEQAEAAKDIAFDEGA